MAEITVHIDDRASGKILSSLLVWYSFFQIITTAKATADIYDGLLVARLIVKCLELFMHSFHFLKYTTKLTLISDIARI